MKKKMNNRTKALNVLQIYAVNFLKNHEAIPLRVSNKDVEELKNRQEKLHGLISTQICNIPAYIEYHDIGFGELRITVALNPYPSLLREIKEYKRIGMDCKKAETITDFWFERLTKPHIQGDGTGVSSKISGSHRQILLQHDNINPNGFEPIGPTHY